MIQRFHGHSPIIHPAARLAANATLVGCVTVEAASSIWYGAVLRGDESSIHVGAGSNIQDNAVLHCDADCPAVIGRDVTVGHGAILHGCSVEDTCLIGMGAILLNGCTIGAGSLVAAGGSASSAARMRSSPPPGGSVPARWRCSNAAAGITAFPGGRTTPGRALRSCAGSWRRRASPTRAGF